MRNTPQNRALAEVLMKEVEKLYDFASADIFWRVVPNGNSIYVEVGKIIAGEDYVRSFLFTGDRLAAFVASRRIIESIALTDKILHDAAFRNTIKPEELRKILVEDIGFQSWKVEELMATHSYKPPKAEKKA